jgi:hypothetical protein
LSTNNTHSGTNTFGPVIGTSTSPTTSPYTFTAADCGETKLIQNASTTVTETIPASIAPVAGSFCNITVIQGGRAQIFVNGATGVAPISPDSYIGTNGGQGSTIGISLTTVSGTATAYLTGRGGALGSTFDPSRVSGGFAALSNSNRTAANTRASNGDTTEYGTLFHTSNAWAFRMVFTSCAATCSVGLSPSTDTIGIAPGFSPNAVGVTNAGNVLINNVSVGSTGITWTTGDAIDVVVDLTNQTIQVSKNGAGLSTAVSISAMTGFNVSPACDVISVGDSCSFNGTPPTTFAGASPWS